MRKKSRLVCGVGINDANYEIKKTEMVGGKQVQTWICPFYRKWQSMLTRAYSEKFLNAQKAYDGVTVCEEWLTFSNFKAWMETQDWEGKQLDKDLLVPGNKVYSPETCVFLSQEVNKFLVEQAPSRGLYLIGVTIVRGQYKAQVRVDGRNKNLGSFSTEIEAHNAWLTEKSRLAKMLALKQNDPRVADALLRKYEDFSNEANS